MRRLLAALLAALLLSGCAALAEPEEVWEKIEETKEDENAASMSAGAGSMTGAEGKGERTGTMQEE